MQPAPPLKKFEGYTYFWVKEVLQSLWRRGHIKYLVDWEGHGPQDCSWEQTAHLTDVAHDVFMTVFLMLLIPLAQHLGPGVEGDLVSRLDHQAHQVWPQQKFHQYFAVDRGTKSPIPVPNQSPLV